jgi:hypothetical protein
MSHDASKVSTRHIIVKETREIHSGRNKLGEAFTLNQVIATKVDGTPIEENLRTFDDLPLNEVVVVEVTPFVLEGSGITSYTLKKKAPSKTDKAMDDLKARVQRIEKHLGLAGNSSPLIPPDVPPPPPIRDEF